jgi:hypothetical protein
MDFSAFIGSLIWIWVSFSLTFAGGFFSDFGLAAAAKCSLLGVFAPTKLLRTSLIFSPLNFPPIPASMRPDSSILTGEPLFSAPFGLTVIQRLSIANNRRALLKMALCCVFMS